MPQEITQTIHNEATPVFNNIRSGAVQELISNKPGLLVNYGISIFFLIMVCIFISCWFIKYPDKITAKARLTSINAPKTVINKSEGKLFKLTVSEGEFVRKGAILGYLESIGKHEEVITLARALDTITAVISREKTEQLPTLLSPSFANLGELQQSYQTFIQAFISFNNYLLDGFYTKKKTLLKNDLLNLHRLHENLILQRDLQQQDLELTQKTFEANQSLKDDKVITDFEYRTEKSKLINKKMSLPQINSFIISNESLQNEKKKEIMELENQVSQQKWIFQQALNTFKSQADDWKKRYLLIAPIDGKVAFATFLQDNQQLRSDEVVCFINPENSKYYTEILIPQANFAKVATGQKVLLKFVSYPYQEYGSLEGIIEFISNIPSDSGYIAKLRLPQGLTTNFNKKIQYREGLLAQGEIITKDMRLLERFYYNLMMHNQ